MKVDVVLLPTASKPPQASAAEAVDPALGFEQALHRAQGRAPHGDEPIADERREQPSPEGLPTAPALPMPTPLPPRTTALAASPLGSPAAGSAAPLAQMQGANWRSLPGHEPQRAGESSLRLQLLGQGLPAQAIELHALAPGRLQLQIHSAVSPPAATRELLRTRLDLRGHAQTRLEWQFGDESPEEASER